MNGITAFSTTDTAAVAYTSAASNTKNAVALGQEKAAMQASVNLTLSPEAVARIKEESASQTPLSQEDIDKNIAYMQTLRADALSIQNSRIPSLDHPLYSDPRSDTNLTELRSFFALAEDGSSQATTALADALYDAVASPLTGWTDTTQGVDIALVREKLEYLNNRYIPQQHQAQVSTDIDNYIQRRLADRNANVSSMLDAELAVAQSLQDQPRIAEAQSAIAAFSQGTHRIQNETAQIFAITTGSTDKSTIADKLTQWYTRSDSTFESQNQQFATLLANWQQFIQKYAA